MAQNGFAVNTDFDCDGRTDFGDFLTLSSNFGSKGMTFAQGDSNFDGTVDFADFLNLSTNFNISSDLHGDWDPRTNTLTVFLTASNPRCRIRAQAGKVSLADWNDPQRTFGVRNVSTSLAMELNAGEVEKLVVRGSVEADTIDLDEVTKAEFPNLEFVESYGYEGADTIRCTACCDRVFGGDGGDRVWGLGETDYFIDYDRNNDVLNNKALVKGLHLVWKWEAGDITATQYHARIAAGTFAGLSGSPHDHASTATGGGTSAFRLNATTSIPDTSLLVANEKVAPLLLGDGKLEAHLRYYNPVHDQCQFKVRGSMKAFDCGHYLFANKRYRWIVVCQPSSDTDWNAIAWNVITQLHPGNPVGLTGASVNLYIRKSRAGIAEWGLLVRGETDGDLTEWDNHPFDKRMPYIPGQLVTIAFEFTLDYRGEAGNAYTRVDINNVLLGETRKTNGLNYDPDGPKGGCTSGSEMLNTGVYSNGRLPTDITKRPQVVYHSAHLYAE